MQWPTTSACHAEDHGSESRTDRHGSLAQSVEQGTENPCVGGSIPLGATMKKNKLKQRFGFFCVKKTTFVVCYLIKFISFKRNSISLVDVLLSVT